MRIAVCDDGAVYRAAISQAVDEWQGRNPAVAVSLSAYASSEDLLEALTGGSHFDLYFLDIEIPDEISGLQLAERIRALDAYTPIVFISNYDQYARAGYQVNALRYLCKPLRSGQIFECLDIACRQWMTRRAGSLVLPCGQGQVVLRPEHILYVEARDHFLVFHLADSAQPLPLRMTLGGLRQRLPGGLLLQCHRSFLVNLNHVEGVEGNDFHMKDRTLVPISSANAARIRSQFIDWTYMKAWSQV